MMEPARTVQNGKPKKGHDGRHLSKLPRVRSVRRAKFGRRPCLNGPTRIQLRSGFNSRYRRTNTDGGYLRHRGENDSKIFIPPWEHTCHVFNPHRTNHNLEKEQVSNLYGIDDNGHLASDNARVCCEMDQPTSSRTPSTERLCDIKNQVPTGI